ncbi:MAG: polyphosphate kinase 1 [Chitinivibrionales bacterium]|nr:polyphosphate kinase 1 [Chitinivibrionales bacterium]MBD3396288.1 polyphosphate kinase 1 [Chitinivibrionales bacterium]
MAARKKDKFINRELSWIEFNARVLEQALDDRVPLLERAKFLAITSSNLDEFFMVRVGGLQTLAAQGITKPDASGMTPARQLEAINERVHAMAVRHYACYRGQVEPLLAREGIRRLDSGDLASDQHKYVDRLFENEIMPVLSPIAASDGGPTPLLANRVLHVVVRIKSPGENGRQKQRFALLPLPPNLERFVTLPSEGGYEFMLLEDLVKLHDELFFPGEAVAECGAFRITRNADMSVREDQAADLLSEMEAVLEARGRSECVRLEIEDSVSKTTLGFLQKMLGVDEQSTYLLPGPLDLSALMQLAALQGFERLQYTPWPPRPSPYVRGGQSVFDAVARQNILLYHPYESFDPVQHFVEQAADDPDVIAIKQVLYRTSKNSPIIAALARAAEKGKYVTVLVELKARFDEARNIEWARELEDAGVQVIYGLKGLKTHAKICLVMRREAQGLQRYAHFGTGNYNEKTARLYSDVSFLTCDEDLGADGSAFFNTVTGYSQPRRYRKLSAAPIGLRKDLISLIEAEAERSRQGQHAHIIAKMNSLVDTRIIRALYAASGAGVKIQLNIRGICCLRPMVKGLSENITVVSIVDRFLEHARIFYFRNGGDERLFLSSADWMPRNLDRRVELLVPVEDTVSRRRLSRILETHFSDTVSAWRLKDDGTYRRVSPGKKKPLQSQEALYLHACETTEHTRQRQRVVFEPHRPPPRNS